MPSVKGKRSEARKYFSLMDTPWKSSVILAPMSKGSNLPFRRLCCEYGAGTTVSEMIFASALGKRNRKDLALLRRHPSEKCFGVQILTNSPDDLNEAVPIIEESGADFIDLNCGCPIDEAVSKGMGANLLDRTKRLENILERLEALCHIPFTVKLRSGYKEGHTNIAETAKMAEKHRAAGLVVHGRTREQRYTGVADWNAVKTAVETVSIPVVGNGDILTWYEAEDRLKLSGACGVMIGRGALIKPWIFQEIRDKKDLNPSARERIAVYLRLAEYMLEHFGSDAHGRRTSASFMAWHFDLLTRWRFLPREEWYGASLEHPLIQTRLNGVYEGDPLDIVLAGYGKRLRLQLADIFIEGAAEKRPQNWLEEKISALAPEIIADHRRRMAEKAAKQEAKAAPESQSSSGLPFCEP